MEDNYIFTVYVPFLKQLECSVTLGSDSQNIPKCLFIPLLFLPFRRNTMTSMEDLAIHIRDVCQLPLIMDSPTPGRGNCFFAGICQQLRRPELQSSNQYTAASLRKAVCEFALARQGKDVQRLARVHDNAAVLTLRASWDSFFTTMKRSGDYAEGPVLYCTSLLLEREIAVISFGNTRENPYLHVPSNATISEKFPLIYLGNLVNLHFQSFIPDVDGDPARLPSLRPVADEALAEVHFNAVKTEVPLISVKAEAKPKLTCSTPRSLKRKKVSASPVKVKKLMPLSELSTMGDNIINMVRMLVKENRRLHAMVRQLEFRLEFKGADDEDYFPDNDDSATDDFILCTPLL